MTFPCVELSEGSDTNTRGATTWEATADVNIAGGQSWSERPCARWRAGVPCRYRSGIRNPEDAGTVTLHGACRVVSDVIITGGAAVLVPRLVGTGDRRQGRRGRRWFHIINGLTATELWTIQQLDTPPGE